MIKNIVKEILYIIKLRKRPLYTVEIEKSSEEDFVYSKYRGTNFDIARSVVKIQHPSTRVGKLIFGKHVSMRKTIELDMVGDITIGDHVIFSNYVKVFTHEHNLKSKKIILSEDENNGVLWSNLTIGNDVYFGINSVITENVTNIPDGVVIGANAVLTKNPEPYEIWGGVPAKKIGERV